MKKNIGGKRGQLFSTDALLAIIVFMLALTILSGTQSQLIGESENRIRAQYRQQAAENSVLLLFSTPGNPSYWETLSDRNSVQSVGLMGEGRAISTSKWAAFQDWNADDYYSLLRVIGLSDQNMYVTLSDVNRIVISYVGISPADVNEVNSVVFSSVYRQQPVVVQVQVYRR